MENNDALVGYTIDNIKVYDFEKLAVSLIEAGDADNFEDASDYLRHETSFYSGKISYILFYPKDNENQTQAEYKETHMEEDMNDIDGLDEAFVGVTSYGAFVYDYKKSIDVFGSLEKLKSVTNELCYTPVFLKS